LGAKPVSLANLIPAFGAKEHPAGVHIGPAERLDSFSLCPIVSARASLLRMTEGGIPKNGKSDYSDDKTRTSDD
jgi:hypothetical protein